MPPALNSHGHHLETAASFLMLSLDPTALPTSSSELGVAVKGGDGMWTPCLAHAPTHCLLWGCTHGSW